jgi:hypothetical protein
MAAFLGNTHLSAKGHANRRDLLSKFKFDVIIILPQPDLLFLYQKNMTDTFIKITICD